MERVFTGGKVLDLVLVGGTFFSNAVQQFKLRRTNIPPNKNINLLGFEMVIQCVPKRMIFLIRSNLSLTLFRINFHCPRYNWYEM